MGLDSYLYRQTFMKSDSGQNNLKITIQPNPHNIDSEKISYISEEIGYWRKQNAIHNWFVQNFADGEDNCRPIYIHLEDLRKLYDICKRILTGSKFGEEEKVYEDILTGEETIETERYFINDKLARELLPTRQGFFFGSTDYDYWYIQGLENTIKFLEPYINRKENWNVTYYYEASW